MENLVFDLHKLFNEQKRYSFPFKEFKKEIPKNGIYIIFERGERFHDLDRIVRVGTHTGENQLLSRLNQHFLKENKNRSIFRKNIGRCILNRDSSPYLHLWELDTTSKSDKEKNLRLLNLDLEQEIERQITEYVQQNLSFCVFGVENKEDRLFWESRIVSTIAKSGVLRPSASWIGNQSPKEKIRMTGLWQVNELFNEHLNEAELRCLETIVNQGNDGIK